MRYFCRTCGTAGRSRKLTPGSFLLELGLWALFIVPGFLYSLWRLSARHRVCRACSSADIIPAWTPEARRLLGRCEVLEGD